MTLRRFDRVSTRSRASTKCRTLTRSRASTKCRTLSVQEVELLQNVELLQEVELQDVEL